ncbi:putative NADPH dehydrogenase [Paramyrothecium foliicola]|nr:putative NADPH dehydrogenase [Paramyrothecium foliicola]
MWFPQSRGRQVTPLDVVIRVQSAYLTRTQRRIFRSSGTAFNSDTAPTLSDPKWAGPVKLHHRVVIVEATTIEPRERNSPQASALQQDLQIKPLRRVADLVHSQGSKPAFRTHMPGERLVYWQAGLEVP